VKAAAAYVSLEGMMADLALETLPAPDTKRWIPRRKAVVLAALRTGLLRIDEACERYGLSADEILSWQRLVERHGVTALRTTRLQVYRSSEKPADCAAAELGSIESREQAAAKAGAAAALDERSANFPERKTDDHAKHGR
jgi:hypothetical protein